MVKSKKTTKVSHFIKVNGKVLIDKWYDIWEYEVSEELYNNLKTTSVVASGLVILL